MLNRGLMVKSIRETWLATLACGVGLASIEAILAYVLPSYRQQFAGILQQFEFVRSILSTLLGIDAGQGLGPEVFHALAWLHPVVLTLLLAHAITHCTRVPAGEIERGTVDLLLGLPVSRWELYRSVTALWLGSGVMVLLLASAGNALGSSRLTLELRPDPSATAIVVVNLFCLYLAVGGLSWLASAMSNHRGRAIGVAFAGVLGSFMINFLAPYWRPAAAISFLSVLDYYDPVSILSSGAWPQRDLGILTAIAAVLWLAGGLAFARRDLSST